MDGSPPSPPSPASPGAEAAIRELLRYHEEEDDVSHSCSIPEDVTAVSHDAAVLASMDDASVDTTLRALIESEIPEFIIESLDMAPSHSLHAHYIAKSAKGHILQLSLPPPIGTRVLRSERLSIRSEAVTLQWLYDISNRVHQVDVDAVEGCRAQEVTGSEIPELPFSEGHQLQEGGGSLGGYLPRLVRSGPGRRVGTKGYSLTWPRPGVTVAALAEAPTVEERASLDFQTGQLLRRIALLHSPTWRFGQAADVLSPTHPKPTLWSPIYGWIITPYGGHKTWSAAFHTLLECALKDAESFQITLSYESIRSEFERFKYLFDAVTRPSLVAINAGEDSNTLVSRIDDEHYGFDKEPCQCQQNLNGGIISCHTPGPTERVGSSQSHTNHTGEMQFCHSDSHQPRLGRERRGHIRITGLQEWCNCVFGDPLLASVLTPRSNHLLWNGLMSRLKDSESSLVASTWAPIQDKYNAHVRLLLYECYHNILAITREFCRRRSDSDDREMPARKRLIQALRKLRELDNAGRAKHPRQDDEPFASKRHKPVTQQYNHK